MAAAAAPAPAQAPPQRARPYQLDAHSAEIRRLVAVEGRTLKQVQDHFVQRYQLYATENMWKKRFRKLELNVKYSRWKEMQKAARLYQQCVHTRVPFRYQVRGHKVITAAELMEYARRRGYAVVDGDLVKVETSAPSADAAATTTTGADPLGETTPIDVDHEEEEADSTMEVDAAPSGTEDSQTVSQGTHSPSTLAADEEFSRDQTSGLTLYRRTTEQDRMGVSSGYIHPSCTRRRAAMFLTQLGNAICLDIAEPDTFRCHEQFLRAVDTSVSIAFTSGQVILADEGWLVTTRFSQVAWDRSSQMRPLFREAANFSQNAQMQRAWKSFYTALSYLCFSLVHHLPEALRQLLRTIDELHDDGHGFLVKIIATQALRWCRTYLQMPEIERIFTTLYEIDDAHLGRVVIQAFTALYEQKKQIVGEFHEEVFPDHFIITSREYKADLPQFKRRMEPLLERCRQFDGDTPFMELKCLRRILLQGFKHQDLAYFTDIADRGLQLSLQLDNPECLTWISTFAGQLSMCCYTAQDVSSALYMLEIALKAETEIEPQNLHRIRDICLTCSGMYRELGDAVEAARYTRLADNALDQVEAAIQDLEDRFQMLEMAQEAAPAGGLSDASLLASHDEHGEEEQQQHQPQKQRTASSSPQQRATTAAGPWRPGVSPADQDVVLADLYDGGEDLQYI